MMRVAMKLLKQCLPYRFLLSPLYLRIYATTMRVLV